jgi:hypothetical protein
MAVEKLEVAWIRRVKRLGEGEIHYEKLETSTKGDKNELTALIIEESHFCYKSPALLNI